MNRFKQLANDLYLAFYYLFSGIILLFIPGSWRYKSLENETVLITGAGSGIGRLLATKLANQVKCLVLWDINGQTLNETCNSLRNLKCTVISHVGDISNPEWVKSTAEKVKAKLNGDFVSIVINNAGVVSGKSFLELTENEITRSFGVNVLSNFWTVQAFLPDMIKAEHGHIVTMASVSSFFGVPKLTDYTASKAAVYMFHETLACELMKEGLDGIKCTAVCPFLVNTGMFAGASTGFTATLDPEYIANKVIHAIKTDQFTLMMPKLFYILSVIRQIVPARTGFYLYKLSGCLDLMTHFTGRPQSTNGKKIKST